MTWAMSSDPAPVDDRPMAPVPPDAPGPVTWQPLQQPDAYPPPWFEPAPTHEPETYVAAPAASHPQDPSVIVHPGQRTDEELEQPKLRLRWAFFFAPLAVLTIAVVTLLWKANVS